MVNLTKERVAEPAAGERHGAGRRLRWILCLVLVPLVLAGLALLWPRPEIQDDLGARATDALAAAGFTTAQAQFDGRDARLAGIPGGREQEAIAVVERVTGVRVAEVESSPAAPAPGAPGGDQGGSTATGGTFGLALAGGTIVLSGSVPDEATRSALLDVARAQAGGRTVVDQVSVTAGSVLPAGVTPGFVGSAIGALGAAPGDRVLSITGSIVKLSGSVPDEAAKAAAAAALHTALPGAEITNGLTAAGLSEAEIQQLQGQLNAVVAASPITFQPNTAQLTPEGAASVSRVLEALRGAPAANLLVSGHVAALGRGGPAAIAQQLSEARAATVAQALVAGGIAADRVAAQGFGDAQPLSTLAASRRVEITIR